MEQYRGSSYGYGNNNKKKKKKKEEEEKNNDNNKMMVIIMHGFHLHQVDWLKMLILRMLYIALWDLTN